MEKRDKLIGYVIADKKNEVCCLQFDIANNLEIVSNNRNIKFLRSKNIPLYVLISSLPETLIKFSL